MSNGGGKVIDAAAQEKHVRKLIYTTERSVPQITSGIGIRNPRYYGKPESGVEAILVVGDYPNIVAEYEALGVQVDVVANLIEAHSGNESDSKNESAQIPEYMNGESQTNTYDARQASEDRKSLMEKLKANGVKFAKNASTETLRSLVQALPTK